MSIATDAPVFDVEIQQGCYDPAAPSEKHLKVTIIVPDLPPVEILLPVDITHSLFNGGGVPWPELAQHTIRLRNACFGTERADIAALTDWLASQRNLDAFYQAWAVYRLRKLEKRLYKTMGLLDAHRARWGLERPAGADVEALADSVGVLGDLSDAR